MIRLSIQRPIAVAMAYLALALLGVAAWRNLPIELYPNTEYPRLDVSAGWPGASPEATEAFVTAPIEAAIQQVRGVQLIRSTSGEGSSNITVEFQRETDMNFARLELSERLDALANDFPSGVRLPLVQPYVPDDVQEQLRPLLSYTVTGPYTTEALSVQTDSILAEPIRRIEGVAGVRIQGGRPRQLIIELDPTRVEAYGLTLGTVQQRLTSSADIREAGIVEVDQLRRTLAIRYRIESMEELRRLPLMTVDGRVVRVGDVAHIRDTFAPATSFYRIDSRPAISFSVVREHGVNAVKVADEVKAKLAELEASQFPGVRLILEQDESAEIREQLTDLRTRSVFSALIIFVVLLVFLRSITSAGLVFATIGFCVLVTLNGVYWAGMSMNVLTLMGLAMGFGLIVDNSIVVLENIYRYHKMGLPAPIAAERGTREVVMPVVSATLTTMIVVVPFVYLQGELRLYYMPMGIVVGISLLASIFVAFTFIPALAARTLDRGNARRDRAQGAAAIEGRGTGVVTGPISESSSEMTTSGIDSAAIDPTESGSTPRSEDISDPRQAQGIPDPPPARKVDPATLPLYVRFYRYAAGLTLRWPWPTVAAAVLMLAGSWHLFDKYVSRNTLFGGFGAPRTTVSVSVTLPRGEEIARTDEMARFFEDKLQAMPSVERYVTNVSTNSANIRVSFPRELEMGVEPLIVQEQLTSYAVQLGGSRISVQGQGPGFSAGGFGGSTANYRIRIFGYNYETVQEIGNVLAQRLRTITRVGDINPNASSSFGGTRVTELVVEPDRARLAVHGLTSQDLVRQVSAAVSNAVGRGSELRVGDERVGYAVKLAGYSDIDVLALNNVAMLSPAGSSVRLSEVATIREREVLGQVIRENQQYERTVAYEFLGPGRLGEVVRDAVIEATELPPGYRIEGTQEFQLPVDERRQIYGVLLLAMVLIFMLTAAFFESIRQPICVLLTVPMALIGVFLTFFYAGASFTREGYIGVIMMAGVVVTNAILLFDHINRLRAEGFGTLEESILQGTLDRSRPILMTSATTVLGLLPLVLFTPDADARIWNAIGYAMIGGLSSSTILVLTVTPALYLLFERGPERRRLGLDREGSV